MKNVCFFNTITFWGGGEKLHLEYAEAFKSKGYNVFVACDKAGELYKRAQEKQLSVFDISAGSLSFLNPFKTSKLSDFFKKNKIDTVIFSTSQDAKLAGFTGRKAKIKNIVYLRGLAVEIKNKPVNKKLLYKTITHIVANSKATKNMVFKNFDETVLEPKTRVIYHGIHINTSTQEKLPNITKNEDEIIIGNAGRLTQQKGQKYLIDLAKELKNKNVKFKIYIAGIGEEQETIQQEIKNNDLETEVILLGFVSKVEAFMSSIDIFALSSLWEGFGYVIVEAMQKSKPVVAFNLSSNPEIIENDKTGYVVDFPNIKEFANKIEVLQKDEKLRLTIGSNALESVKNRFEINERITEFEQYLLKS